MIKHFWAEKHLTSPYLTGHWTPFDAKQVVALWFNIGCCKNPIPRDALSNSCVSHLCIEIYEVFLPFIYFFCMGETKYKRNLRHRVSFSLMRTYKNVPAPPFFATWKCEKYVQLFFWIMDKNDCTRRAYIQKRVDRGKNMCRSNPPPSVATATRIFPAVGYPGKPHLLSDEAKPEKRIISLLGVCDLRHFSLHQIVSMQCSPAPCHCSNLLKHRHQRTNNWFSLSQF